MGQYCTLVLYGGMRLHIACLTGLLEMPSAFNLLQSSWTATVAVLDAIVSSIVMHVVNACAGDGLDRCCPLW